MSSSGFPAREDLLGRAFDVQAAAVVVADDDDDDDEEEEETDDVTIEGARRAALTPARSSSSLSPSASLSSLSSSGRLVLRVRGAASPRTAVGGRRVSATKRRDHKDGEKRR